jgi:hypothetical protein
VTASATKKRPLAISRKPMARAVRVTLFEREVRERLSTSAIEILFQRARVLSEGRRSDSPTARAAWFGSTMLTLDLAELADVIRDAPNEETARKLAAMIDEDPRVQKRVRQIAAAEAEHIAGGPCGARAVELRVRTEGAIVYLDVDVESPAGKPS